MQYEVSQYGYLTLYRTNQHTHKWSKRMAGLLLLLLGFLALSASTASSAVPDASSYQPVVRILMPTATPASWLDGIPEANGFKKDALSGPLQYAKDSGYEFAATEHRLKEMVAEGTLVELKETTSLRFNDVSRPYVLPVVATFVYRLANQHYYEQGCGQLVLNSGARDIEFQRTLANGSEKSVHPTGMAVDFQSAGMPYRCQTWLKQTLLSIEADQRIDYTEEHHPAHHHVTVATHEYERWLERQ